MFAPTCCSCSGDSFLGARWVSVVWDSTLCSGSSLYRKPVAWSIGEGGGALGALQHTQSMPLCMWNTQTPASGRNELVRRMCAACTSSHQLEHFVFFHHRSPSNTHTHDTCAEQCVKAARMRLVFWHLFQILSRQSGWGKRGKKELPARAVTWFWMIAVTNVLKYH